MAKHPIFRRGNVWWVRKRVPVDLARYNGEQDRRTLNTEDRGEAIRSYPGVLADIERDFARARHELETLGNVAGALRVGRLDLLSRQEVEHLAQTWWIARRGRQEGALARLQWPDEREDALLSAREDAHSLTDPDRSAGDEVRRVADQLLVQAGVASRPKRFGKITASARLPSVDRDTAQYGYLCELVSRALHLQVPLVQDYLLQQNTAPRDQLFNPSGLGGDAEHAKGPTVADLIKGFRSDRDAEHPDTWKKYAHIFRALEQLLGAETPVKIIGREECRKIRETISALPRDATKKWPKLDLQEAIEAGRAVGAPLLSPTSVGSYMSGLRAIMNWAKKEGWIDQNPVEGLVKRGKKMVKREGFSADQLETIFLGLAPLREIEAAKFWVPALALFTGARMSEMLQLHVADVAVIGGVHCLNLTEFDTLTGVRSDDKRIKNESSERFVPLHPQLIEAGFMSYVAERRDAGGLRLFMRPNLELREDYAHALSKWFGRFMDSIGLTSRALVFHGFRHGFRNACRHAQIPQETAEALGGWASINQSAKYGDRGMLPVLNRAIRKLKFGGFRLVDHVK